MGPQKPGGTSPHGPRPSDARQGATGSGAIARGRPPRYVPYFNIILGGFVHLVLIGGILLALPFASADRTFTSPLTSFFTAISAVTATGLVVVDTHDHWSPAGQFIILCLIQLGGLGYMTLTAFVLMLLRHRLNVRDQLVTEAADLGGRRHFLWFAWGVILVTLLIEAVGALLLFLRLNVLGEANTLWQSAFHSISAFNNAGFDLRGGFTSLVGFREETYILGVLGGLLILGGLGVPLLLELFTRRPWTRWSLDAKLSVTTVFWLVVLGAAGVFVVEMVGSDGGSSLSPGARAVNAFFLSAAARTAGFDSLGVGQLTIQTLLLLMVLMFIGGVSGSTAGGIKVNTFTTIFLTAVSYIRGHRRVHAFGRVIPESQVHRAISIVFLGTSFIFLLTLLMTITERGKDFVSLLFEVVSAITTTGFTVGITRELSMGGQVIIMIAMFIGRLGPLTAVLALTQREQVVPEPAEPEEPIRIG